MDKQENKKAHGTQPTAHKEVDIELERYKKLAKENLAGWQRAKADFLNYKQKQGERDKELKKDFLMQILPMVDNIETAIMAIPMKDLDASWAQGLEFMRKSILDDLESNFGLKQIRPVGKFDSNKHEAVERIGKETKDSFDVIKEIVQFGYELDGEMIRWPKVIIERKRFERKS